ncbi:MAG: glycosyltransferase family 2 protein [Lachnospiraceae bacterium]|nr:glycosyltransferase family 2 protein [Lachnospiraceae bacterium]
MLVSIVIPCYNSEHTIERVADACFETFEKLDGYDYEMILVNDYSKDDTFGAITRVCQKYSNVKGVNLARNFGQHCAIMAGLHYVNGDFVVGMDDDLQNHPDQIVQFLAKAEEGYDVVFGVFKERKFNAFKNLTGAVSRFLLWHLLERPKDIQMSSFWLARRYVIEKVKEYEGDSPFIQLLFFRTTYNMANIEIEHFAREVGQSNYTFRKGLRLFLSMISYTVAPLQWAYFFGVAFSMVGFLGGIIVFAHKLLNPNTAVGWSSIMCVLFIFFGIVFLMLGVIGDYLGKMVLNLSRKPQYVVRDEINVSADLPTGVVDTASGRTDTIVQGKADETGRV